MSKVYHFKSQSTGCLCSEVCCDSWQSETALLTSSYLNLSSGASQPTSLVGGRTNKRNEQKDEKKLVLFEYPRNDLIESAITLVYAYLICALRNTILSFDNDNNLVFWSRFLNKL